MVRVSEVITTDEIKTWTSDNIISITAGTGVGKSYFIKNILYAFAKSNNKKILFLIHRTNCTDQFYKELKKDNKLDVIDIRTYQSIEAFVKNKKKFDFSKYQYIVSDEFHYFMGDASFNVTTDMSLNQILKQNDCIRIFMSATGEHVKNYINNTKGYSMKEYNLPITYDFIKQLTFFNLDDTMEEFIKECINSNDKAIFFIQSAKKAYELYNKYKDNCIFNCSKSNDEYYKYVDTKVIDSILENERFEKNILITTTCFDAGVNIIDKDLKHIVCDVEDVDTLIQCIGRKRLQDDEDKIYLYVKTINNQSLGGKETQLKSKIKMADFARKHTVKEYVDEFPRGIDYHKIVYDVSTDDEDTCTKQINELMYFKCKCDIVQIEIMKLNGDYGYNKYLAKKLGFIDKDGNPKYRLIEEEKANDDLEFKLEELVGNIFLQTKDRKAVIDLINVRINGHQLKKIGNLNGALEEREIPYRIVEFSTSKIIDGKKKNFKSAWKIEKLVG